MLLTIYLPTDFEFQLIILLTSFIQATDYILFTEFIFLLSFIISEKKEASCFCLPVGLFPGWVLTQSKIYHAYIIMHIRAFILFQRLHLFAKELLKSKAMWNINRLKYWSVRRIIFFKFQSISLSKWESHKKSVPWSIAIFKINYIKYLKLLLIKTKKSWNDT